MSAAKWLEVAADAVREHDRGDMDTDTGWASDDLFAAWQTCNEAAIRIADLEDALRLCQRALAMIIEPSVISGVSIQSAFASCKAAEVTARAILEAKP